MKTITIGGNKGKETEEIKELRKKKNENKATYQKALQNNRQAVQELQKALFQSTGRHRA